MLIHDGVMRKSEIYHFVLQLWISHYQSELSPLACRTKTRGVY